MLSHCKKAAVMALICILIAAPLSSASAVLYPDIPGVEWVTDASQIRAEEFTDNPVLARRLQNVFNGHAELYWDGDYRDEAAVPLGSCTVTNDTWMLSCPGGQRGWSCYIYANGAYYALFGECPGDGTHRYRWSEVRSSVSGDAEELYGEFRKADIRQFGAYCRTGSHSFLILHYDRNGLVLLDGNSVNGEAGLVQVTRCTWEYFWRYYLSCGSNPIDHVVQPTEGTDVRLLIQAAEDERAGKLK